MLDLLDFALAQQAVVHEHAGELVADGLVYQSGGHGGINAAGQAADHLGVADLLADLLDLILDNRGGIPVVGQRGATVQEVFDKLLAKRGVLDFRVPLHTIELAGFVRHGGHGRAFGVGQHFEAGRGLFDRHARWLIHVVCSAGESAKMPAASSMVAEVLPYSPSVGLIHLAAELIGHDLEAVADTKHPEHRIRIPWCLWSARRARTRRPGRQTE